MSLTKAQRKANARNQLFRQIHGYSLVPFISRAIRENAITPSELNALNEIGDKLEYLKANQFANSKNVGLHPRRRCSCCNGIARWKLTMFDESETFLCNKHKEEYKRDNKQNIDGDWMITSITPIDPNK